MIDVHTQPERMIFREDCAKLGRDALRKKDRDARADAQELDVFDRAQPRKQLVDLIVAEDQRVAAAQKHIPHFGVLFEIAECFLEIRVKFLFADAADDAGARAISTVTGAAIGHEK